MKYTPVVLLTLALVGGIICAGCIAAPSATQPSPNGSWMLETNNNITLTINGTEVNGFSGVNNYFGSVEISTNGTFIPGPLGMTMMAGPADLEAAEQAFHGALNTVTSYKITDGKLVLTDKDGKTVLTFVKAPVDSLSGTSWMTADGQTISFADGKISGNGGINTYNAVFTLKGDNDLVFGAVASTKMAGPADLTEKENAFFAALGSTAAYKITDGKLVLTDKDGKTLLSLTTAPANLDETSWTTADGQTIVFTDSKVSGFGGINTYNAAVTINGDKIVFGAVASTKMAGPANLTEKENAFFAALGSTAAYKITDGKLILTDKDGKTLLTLSEGDSLAGTSWKGANGTTLMFTEDGNYNGKAPVNSYFGGYTVVGDSLTLGATVSTLMAGSPEEMAQETAFFTALSNTVGFEVTSSTLSLLDENGTVLLTFTAV